MMAYLIDRQRAMRLSEVVAVRSLRRGRSRSQVIFRDNSLLWTLTRPRTLLQCDAQDPAQGVRMVVS
ncbi:MAG: hypothetical protein HY598_04205 [Candidatus Omnitrophica bacterium]|nr:hypothetical protein [Candidatus Omnitrophota bacterium]